VQEHLLGCRPCLDELLELDSFVAPEEESAAGAARTADTEAGAGGVADLETAAAWRAMRSRLPPRGSGLATGLAAAGRRAPAWLAAAAAVLLVAVGALSLWAVAEHRAASALRQRVAALARPQTDAAIVDLFPAGARRGEEEQAVELPADAGHLTLVVNLPSSAAAAARYRVEIADAAGRAVWSGDGLTPSRFLTLRLGLPRGFLAPGDYDLRVTTADDGEGNEVATYPLRVAPP
jgi:hypothetical protein